MKKKSDYFLNKLTNPTKLLYPAEGITKKMIAEYYIAVQDWILPYIIQRPLTLVRCPQGKSSKCFYQKHLHGALIPSLYSVEIKEKEKKGKYIFIKNMDGLISLIQLGVLEIHPWGSRIDDVERPDMIIFDLDPATDLEWKKVIQAAFLIKDELEKINLQSFIKTTGGKGLHVVVPIKRKYNWDQIKTFSKLFAEYIVSLKPNEYISTMSKSKRSNKIFIDYFRNQRGATAVSAYSTRVKEGATISTPLAWNELSLKIKSDSFNIQNFPKRLANLKKDPWENFLKLHQVLPLK